MKSAVAEGIDPPRAAGRCHGSFPSASIHQNDRENRFEVDTMKEYKFSLVMENEYSHGYITEKIIQGFLFSTIPIYYGTKEVFDLFNQDAFVFWDIAETDGGGALDLIIKLATDENKYREMLSKPVLKHPQQETLSKYFSIQDDVGGGELIRKIRLMMRLGEQSGTSHSPIIRGRGEYKLQRPTGKIEGSNHWSQDGQDSFVDRLLRGRKNGFFLEIGGYDGELHTNTLFFEKERDWDGLLIETNPFTFQQMVSRDRKCFMVNACISRTNPSMSFLVAGGLTSAVDVMSDAHKRRIEHDTKTYGTTDTWDGVGNTIETNCTTINHLLDSIGVRHVDYFSLDVEGAEILVLESIAFSEVTVDVFTIEKQEHREQVQTFMKGIGYRIIEDSENKLSLDDVYVRDDIVIA
jgi:hypothetical protein